MTEKDDAIARELKDRLSEVVQVVDFRIFGSRARGETDEYSDMDVFLEVESLDKELENRISDIAWKVGYKHTIVISLLVFTRDDIERSPLKASPIVKNIVAEGVLV